MIVIVPTDGKYAEYFENYDELFDYIMAIENEKLIVEKPNFQKMNWSFTIHALRRVIAFYPHLKETNEAIKEAYEEDLSLIEICAGDYTNPTYIALTPNVDLDYLKKKWCVDYCSFYNLVMKEV